MTCLQNLQKCPETKTGSVFKSVKFIYDPEIKNVEQMISKEYLDAIRGTRVATVNVFFKAFLAPEGSPFYGKKLDRLGNLC